MVAHNGGAYLPKVLSALAAQTRPADLVLAADTASTDNSGELLRKELGERQVISLDGRKGYGSAVDAVLEHQARMRAGASAPAGVRSGGVGLLDEPASGRNEWIWLLQDDAEPAPDALQLLLEATERATTATVVGCKQLDWDNHRRLVDVGLWADKWFDRFTLVGIDEQDQGQYDDHADMFAVNTAGMLVRRDVYEKLGGFDPALPGPGDDIDFCARVRLQGDRVLVVPDAHMYHVAHRPEGMGSAVAARKAGIFLRLKHAPAWAVPFLAAGTFLAALYWLVAGFVLKAPGHAVRMFAATCAGLLRPITLFRSRRALAARRTKPRSSHRGLLVNGRAARAHLKMLRETLDPDEDPSHEQGPGTSILEPTGETHQQAVAPLAPVKTSPIISALALTVLLAILSLLALSRILGAPALTGGAMLPVAAQLGQVWAHATSWWVSLGSGLPGAANPFNMVLFLLSALGGDGSKAVVWLVLLALPLSAFSAWLGAGAVTLRRWPRVVAGLLWAGVPVLLVGLGQGRLGAVVAHILIPIVMLGLIRAVGAGAAPEPRTVLVPGALAGSDTVVITKLGRPGVGGNPSWTAAAAAGLALAAATAAAPSLFPVAVVGIMLTAVFMGRRGKTVWWALIPPAALFLPLGWSTWQNPRALLADPGMPLVSLPGPVWQQLLGFPDEVDPSLGLSGLGDFAGAPWLGWPAVVVIGAPLVLAAAVALVLPLRRTRLVRVLWLVALLGLAAAFAGKFIAVAFDGVNLVTPFNGPAVSLTLFALLGAALLGFDALARRAWESGSDSSRHRMAKTMATVLSIVLVAAPVASLGLWSTQQFTGQLGASSLTGPFLPQAANVGIVPATAADRGTGPEASRTIVLTVLADGGVHASLMQGEGTTLDATNVVAGAARISGAPGEEKLAPVDAATAVLEGSVATILSKSGIDPRPGLIELGVGFVVLRPGDTAAELLASEMEAVPGLDTVGPTESGWLWRVKPNYKDPGSSDVINRVRLVDAGGTVVAPVPSNGQSVDAAIPAADGARRVVMAERFDAGWQATLDGAPLKAVSAGWAQAFELPAGAGQLQIRFVEPMNLAIRAVQLVLFGLTLLLALPVRARRGRTGAYRDEASLQRVGRGA